MGCQDSRLEESDTVGTGSRGQELRALGSLLLESWSRLVGEAPSMPSSFEYPSKIQRYIDRSRIEAASRGDGEEFGTFAGSFQDIHEYRVL